MNPSVKIFAGTGSQALAEKIAQRFGAPIGKINIQKFSDGEFQPIFLESIRGDYVFLVQSTYAPSENIMELLMMIDAAKRASAYKIIVVIPYYGFARQDRKDKPRVAIGAKLIATLLEAAGAHRVITDGFNPINRNKINLPLFCCSCNPTPYHNKRFINTHNGLNGKFGATDGFDNQGIFPRLRQIRQKLKPSRSSHQPTFLISLGAINPQHLS